MAITKYQFRKLLTFEEKATITEAAKTNSYVQTLLDDLFSAGDVDLNLPEVEQGLLFLVSLGILSSGRDTEIINTGKGLPQIEDPTLPTVSYQVTVKAQDVITPGNPWGIVKRGDYWEVRCDFRNETDGRIFNEVFGFKQEEQPTQEQLNEKVQELLKKVSNL